MGQFEVFLEANVGGELTTLIFQYGVLVQGDETKGSVLIRENFEVTVLPSLREMESMPFGLVSYLKAPNSFHLRETPTITGPDDLINLRNQIAGVVRNLYGFGPTSLDSQLFPK